MKIALTGSSGFVGSQLKKILLEELKCEIVLVSRSDLYGSSQQLASILEGCFALINLAGFNVLGARWSPKVKQILWDSRVETTHNIVDALRLLKNPPEVFISTSATGLFNNKDVHDEYSLNYADNFLGRLCWHWENEARHAETLGVRTIIFRLGVVLGCQGGAFKKMLPLFKIGLGGYIGSGEQPFPFIHIKDLLNAYLHVLHNDKCCGIYHLVAPHIVSNKDFTQVLAGILNRPSFFSVPVWILKLLYGQGAQVLTHGQTILTNRLVESGFHFNYPNLKDTISDLL